MRFSILGEVRVDRDGEPVAVRACQQSVVLGVLLARVGRTVDPDELIRCVWGDQAPADARGALSRLVSRLRAFLDGPHLMTIGGGYRLVLAPADLDLTVFRGQVRAARLSDTPAIALLRLRGALRMWRGVPLTGVCTPHVAATVVTDLEAERVAALRLVHAYRRLVEEAPHLNPGGRAPVAARGA